jgi:hypothetical protein
MRVLYIHKHSIKWRKAGSTQLQPGGAEDPTSWVARDRYCRAFGVSITRCITCMRLAWDICAHLAPSTLAFTFIFRLQFAAARCLDAVNLDGEACRLLQPMDARVSRGHGALTTVQVRWHQIFLSHLHLFAERRCTIDRPILRAPPDAAIPIIANDECDCRVFH